MTDELQQALGAIADGVTLNPAAAGVTFSSASDLVGVCEVHTSIRSHDVVADEPAMLCGADAGPNPLEFALAALGSCWAITVRFWATKLGMRVDSCSIEVRGDVDVRGLFGLDPAVRPGYRNVQVDVTVTGPESSGAYDVLARTVEQHCPVRDIFANETPVATTLKVV